MDNMKMVNLYTEVKRVNRRITFIKFRANSYSATVRTFITFRTKIYYT